MNFVIEFSWCVDYIAFDFKTKRVKSQIKNDPNNLSSGCQDSIDFFDFIPLWTLDVIREPPYNIKIKNVKRESFRNKV